MSDPLSAQERANYSAMIDGILETSDLQTVTRKKIRAALEAKLGGTDLSAQKNAIKKLIEERFDALNGVPPPSSMPEPTPKKTNGHRISDEDTGSHGDDDADADEEIEVSTQPARKKQKRDPSLDADAKLAAELQAQEDRAARGRTTRGGGASAPKTKKASKKKAPKKKSATKVKDEDDSDLDTEESGTRKRKAGGGFQKPFNLSEPLGELLGETQLSRPQVVKHLWRYIKGNELQDPKDRRLICCDDLLQAVFKMAKVDMFQMNKLIGSHLYPIDE